VPQITLARVWAALSLYEKAKIIWGIVSLGVFLPDSKELAKLVEGMKDSDLITEAIKVRFWREYVLEACRRGSPGLAPCCAWLAPGLGARADQHETWSAFQGQGTQEPS
jgi:hypothetical protein